MAATIFPGNGTPTSTGCGCRKSCSSRRGWRPLSPTSSGSRLVFRTWKRSRRRSSTTCSCSGAGLDTTPAGATSMPRREWWPTSTAAAFPSPSRGWSPFPGSDVRRRERSSPSPLGFATRSSTATRSGSSRDTMRWRAGPASLRSATGSGSSPIARPRTGGSATIPRRSWTSGRRCASARSPRASIAPSREAAARARPESRPLFLYRSPGAPIRPARRSWW